MMRVVLPHPLVAVTLISKTPGFKPSLFTNRVPLDWSETSGGKFTPVNTRGAPEGLVKLVAKFTAEKPRGKSKATPRSIIKGNGVDVGLKQTILSEIAKT